VIDRDGGGETMGHRKVLIATAVVAIVAAACSSAAT
jgi:hypothetical protein